MKRKVNAKSAKEGAKDAKTDVARKIPGPRVSALRAKRILQGQQLSEPPKVSFASFAPSFAPFAFFLLASFPLAEEAKNPPRLARLLEKKT